MPRRPTRTIRGMHVGVEFRLPAKIRKKGRWFVSSCPSLDVHSQGHTKEEARRNLVDALVFFLESCFERGTLDAVLRGSELWNCRATASRPLDRFRVPC